MKIILLFITVFFISTRVLFAQQPVPQKQGVLSNEEMMLEIQKNSEESVGIANAMSKSFLEELQQSETNSFVMGIKLVASGLCVVFLLINLINNWFNSKRKIEENMAASFTIQHIIMNFFWISVVMALPYLFVMMEKVMYVLTNSIQSRNNAIYSTMASSVSSFVGMAIRDKAVEVAKQAADITILGTNVKGAVGAIGQAFAPNKYVYTFASVNIVLAFFNYVMAFMLFFERYVLMFILKILAPFIFAFYILDSDASRSSVFKFFKILITMYLILPIGLIVFNVVDNLFLKMCTASGIIENVFQQKDVFSKTAGNILDFVGALTGWDTFLFSGMLLLSIALKFSFLKKTTEILWRIFL